VVDGSSSLPPSPVPPASLSAPLDALLDGRIISLKSKLRITVFKRSVIEAAIVAQGNMKMFSKKYRSLVCATDVDEKEAEREELTDEMNEHTEEEHDSGPAVDEEQDPEVDPASEDELLSVMDCDIDDDEVKCCVFVLKYFLILNTVNT
jgi:hypothetical protein